VQRSRIIFLLYVFSNVFHSYKGKTSQLSRLFTISAKLSKRRLFKEIPWEREILNKIKYHENCLIFPNTKGDPWEFQASHVFSASRHLESKIIKERMIEKIPWGPIKFHENSLISPGIKEILQKSVSHIFPGTRHPIFKNPVERKGFQPRNATAKMC